MLNAFAFIITLKCFSHYSVRIPNPNSKLQSLMSFLRKILFFLNSEFNLPLVIDSLVELTSSKVAQFSLWSGEQRGKEHKERTKGNHQISARILFRVAAHSTFLEDKFRKEVEEGYTPAILSITNKVKTQRMANSGEEAKKSRGQ